MEIPDRLSDTDLLRLSTWSHGLVERGVMPRKWKRAFVFEQFEHFKLYYEERPRLREKRKDVVRSFQRWMLNAERYRQEQERDREWRGQRWAKQGQAAEQTERVLRRIK